MPAARRRASSRGPAKKGRGRSTSPAAPRQRRRSASRSAEKPSIAGRGSSATPATSPKPTDAAKASAKKRVLSRRVECDTVEYLNEEVTHYRERGYGAVAAVAMGVGIFVGLPTLGRHLWPRVIEVAGGDMVHYVTGGKYQLPEFFYRIPLFRGNGEEGGSMALWHIYVVGMLLLHGVVFWGGNLLLWLCCYRTELPFFERYKVQDKIWPWKQTGVQLAKWREQLNDTYKTLFLNHAILQSIALLLTYRTIVRFNLTSPLEQFPEWWEIVTHLLVFMFMEDTMFYWAHRALHDGRIYAYVHKQHHQYKHSIGICAEYAHPIEYALSNMVPFAAGPLLMRCHVFTWWMWTLWRIGETVDAHSGYSFSWSVFRFLPWSHSARAHDWHHSHNKGNYGSWFTFWDWFCGTDEYYRGFLQANNKPIY